MADRVGIVAVAQTKYEASKPRQRPVELVFEVVEKLLEETGLTFAQDGSGIDSTVTCSQDFWDGRTISNVQVMPAVGGYRRAEVKVAEDGAHAVFCAMAQILSGRSDVVLVCAHTKESETHRNVIENAAFDPIYERPLGVDFISAAAMQARVYMHRYGVRPEQCAQVVVKNRGNAKRNPFAQAPMDLTVEDVLNSRMLASPIHQLEVKPVSDGACAVILAREQKAKRLTARPAWIMGISSCYDAFHLGDRDLASCDALVKAAKKAYDMASISDPSKEVHVAEISEEFSYQELLWSEGLGFCERGDGGELLEKGVTAFEGKLPVNPSGGLLSGRPTNVAGLAAVAEAALQVRGEAGAHQVPGAKTAVAHGVGGPCGQLHCVVILGSQGG